MLSQLHKVFYMNKDSCCLHMAHLLWIYDSCFVVTHLTVENLLEVARRPLVNRHLDDFLLFDGSLSLTGLAAARSRDRLTPPLTVTAHALHTSPLSRRHNKHSYLGH
jgi:hypothetical protein